MTNLYDPARVAEIRQRLASMTQTSTRQWGKMTAPQMLAHCSIALECALGDLLLPRMFAGRILGPIVTPLVFKDDKPLKKNSPTAPSYVVADERDLDAERSRLDNLITRFANAGPKGATAHPHTFFGKLTPEQWSILMYKHLDHHFRQFGA